MEKWCPGVTLIVDGGDNAAEGHGEMVIWKGKRGGKRRVRRGNEMLVGGGDGDLGLGSGWDGGKNFFFWQFCRLVGERGADSDGG